MNKSGFRLKTYKARDKESLTFNILLLEPPDMEIRASLSVSHQYYRGIFYGDHLWVHPDFRDRDFAQRVIDRAIDYANHEQDGSTLVIRCHDEYSETLTEQFDAVILGKQRGLSAYAIDLVSENFADAILRRLLRPEDHGPDAEITIRHETPRELGIKVRMEIGGEAHASPFITVSHKLLRSHDGRIAVAERLFHASQPTADADD